MSSFRSANGFTNHRPDDPLGRFGMIDPSRYSYWFSDFHKSEGITAATAEDWTVTKTGTPTVALGDADGGVIVFTNSAADNDNYFLQKLGESFLWEATKKLAIVTRFKLSEATQSDIAIGLQITDTTPLDVTDGIFFYKADESAVLTARVEKNNSAAAGNVVTMANDTYVEVAIVYNGKPYADINGTATYPFRLYQKDSGGIWRGAGTIAATTTAPDDEELTVSIGVQNGEAVSQVLTVDYFLAAKER